MFALIMLSQNVNALCAHNERLTKLHDNNEITESQVIRDEMKTTPFGYVWDEYCRQYGVKCDREWFDEVKLYERKVLIKR